MSDMNLSYPRDFGRQSFMAIDVVYKLKKNVGTNNFLAQFIEKKKKISL